MNFLKRIFRRRSSPSAASAFRAATPNIPGITVDEQTAVYVPAVLQAARVLSSVLGTYPLHLYRESKSGASERIPTYSHHAAMRLEEPNPETTGVEFRESLVASMVIGGRGVAEIVRESNREDGEIQGLWVLPWWRTELKRDPQDKPYVKVTNAGGKKPAELYAPFAIHSPSFSIDGFRGVAPIESARMLISRAIAIENLTTQYFVGGAWPGGFLKTKKQFPTEGEREIYLRNFVAGLSGLGKVSKWSLLDDGMEVEMIDFDLSKIAPETVEKSIVRQVARAFGVPPQLLLETEGINRASAEQFGLEALTYTFLPHAVRLEKRFALSMLTQKERASGFYFRHNLDALLRADAKSRAEALALNVQWAIMSPDEARALEERAPIEGGHGKLPWRPVNYVPIDKSSDIPAAPAARSRVEVRRALRAIEPLLSDALARCERRMRADLDRMSPERRADHSTVAATIEASRDWRSKIIHPVIEAAANIAEDDSVRDLRRVLETEERHVREGGELAEQHRAREILAPLEVQ